MIQVVKPAARIRVPHIHTPFLSLKAASFIFLYGKVLVLFVSLDLKRLVSDQ